MSQAPAQPRPDVPSVPVDSAATTALLRAALEEATVLLEADGGLVYRPDGTGAVLRLLEDASFVADESRAAAANLRIPVGAGLFGLAYHDRRVTSTGDYMADGSFRHDTGADAFVVASGIRSMIVAPLVAGASILGALGVFATRPDAFSERDRALVRALATHAATTLANSTLIEALERSRAQLERRSERERTLRELVGSLAAIRDPDVLLQHVVQAATTVTGARGAFLDRVTPEGRLHTAFTENVTSPAAQAMLGEAELEPPAGVMGRAMAEGRVVRSDDYLGDDSFAHMPDSDALARELGIRSLVAAPLVADGEVLGVLAAYSDVVAAFDDEATALVAAFADHAAVAVANAGLIAELEHSRAQLTRRSERERSLRELVGSLAAIRDPDVLLERIAEAAKAVTGATGILLDRVEPVDDTHILYTEQAATPEARTMVMERAGLAADGLMGKALAEQRVIRTDDYLTDDAFVHRPESDGLARDRGVRSVVAVPLIAEGEVVGVLAAYSDRVAAFDDEASALVATFADHAAVAVANARLIDALDRSESRYRGLLAASPDIIFAVDADGRFTYLSDTLQRQLDWTVPEMLGQHFGALIDVSSMGDAQERWRALQASPGTVLDARFLLIHHDGRRIPYEIRSFGIEEDGRFVGVQGAARDVSERERLESELRESRERYRHLVKASPDVVWAVDVEGRFTFLSDRLEPLTGFRPDEMLGHHFGDLTPPEHMGPAMEVWAAVQRDPSGVHPLSMLMTHRDGPPVPVDVWVTGLVSDGAFAGAHGSIRDLRDRERLERELRESEARYRYLVDNSPDVVWSSDADGLITYISETSEQLLGWRPDEVIGQHFSLLIHPDSLGYVGGQYAASLGITVARDLRYRFEGRHRDGSRVPLEMHARTIVEDGVYRGVHGAVRDLRERERLERDLRRQAADLAAGEERAHLARELHDSVTQALFSMTLVTRSIELLMGRDPAAAAAKLETLRELQRDALAEMRALIFELRPASLEQDGLVQALRTHSAAVEGRAGLGIIIEADDQEERLPAEIEAALFRIAQEALNNVVKHAAASHVHIAVERTAGAACLRVSDDGSGFDPDRVPDGHLGVAGMRARAEKLGGSCTVTSAPGRGTTIEVTVPLAGQPVTAT